LKKAEDEVGRVDVKLSNQQFVARAPEEVLLEQREKRREAAEIVTRLKDAIARLE
jgi:valyl-tRNA synthetase